MESGHADRLVSQNDISIRFIQYIAEIDACQSEQDLNVVLERIKQDAALGETIPLPGDPDDVVKVEQVPMEDRFPLSMNIVQLKPVIHLS